MPSHITDYSGLYNNVHTVICEGITHIICNVQDYSKMPSL